MNITVPEPLLAEFAELDESETEEAGVGWLARMVTEAKWLQTNIANTPEYEFRYRYMHGWIELSWLFVFSFACLLSWLLACLPACLPACLLVCLCVLACTSQWWVGFVIHWPGPCQSLLGCTLWAAQNQCHFGDSSFLSRNHVSKIYPSSTLRPHARPRGAVDVLLVPPGPTGEGPLRGVLARLDLRAGAGGVKVCCHRRHEG